nr:hypothetical protein GCM10011355_07090 [Aquisalinus luteolus]
MKAKIQAVSTATGALKFGMNNILLTLKLYWVGMLLFVGGYALSFLGAIQLAGGFDALESGEAAVPFWPFLLVFVVVMGLGALAFAPASVRLARIIAGDAGEPSGIGYLKFTGREWRYVKGMVILGLIYLFLVFVPTMLPMAFVNLETGEIPAFLSMLPLLMFIIMLVFLWFMLRLVTFLPMIAIEDRLSFRDAFRMTKGNVWRIVGSFLLLYLMLVGIYFAVFFGVALVSGIVMIPLSLTMQGGEPGALTIILGVVLGLVSLVFYFAMIAFMGGSFHAWGTKVYLALARPAVDEPAVEAAASGSDSPMPGGQDN